eukprot:5550074-Lingulodinium_polyedra.AAC.1
MAGRGASRLHDSGATRARQINAPTGAAPVDHDARMPGGGRTWGRGRARQGWSRCRARDATQ